MSKIQEGRLAISDEGYQGEPQKVSTKNNSNPVELNKLKSRVQARHETLNSRLKAFGILNQVPRTKCSERMEKHKSAFEACCVIVQYQLDNAWQFFICIL